MATDFHTAAFRGAYTGRAATSSWLDFIRERLQVQGRRALEVGCGGGIYSHALLELGAEQVTGLDSSEVSLRDARAQPHPQLAFVCGEATALPFEAGSFDLILARALIHHLDREGLARFAQEARRCLSTRGVLIVQDRTVADALAPGTVSNPRGYLYDVFPSLGALEASRRHSDEAVRAALEDAGFGTVERAPLREERKVYADARALCEEVRARRGRSILHELSDPQLRRYADLLAERFAGQAPIVEREPWSVWVAAQRA